MENKEIIEKLEKIKQEKKRIKELSNQKDSILNVEIQCITDIQKYFEE